MSSLQNFILILMCTGATRTCPLIKWKVLGRTNLLEAISFQFSKLKFDLFEFEKRHFLMQTLHGPGTKSEFR